MDDLLVPDLSPGSEHIKALGLKAVEEVALRGLQNKVGGAVALARCRENPIHTVGLSNQSVLVS